MYILTNEQMRAADIHTIENLHVPSLLLMERAGIALAEEAEKMLPDGKIVCLCGGGNNGGDGFVCARVLRGNGRSVAVVCNAEKFSPDCRVNMEKWIGGGGEILTEIDEDCALIVDCLYGTGFHGSLSDTDSTMVAQAILLKRMGTKILSADIPSGVNGDNGQVRGVAMFADKTLCIGEIKAGVFLGDGIDHAGEVVRADIGISLKDDENYAQLMDCKYASKVLPKRPRNSHKGTYGKTAIVAGSTTYTGAAYLSAAACLRSGVGYTALYVPGEVLPHYVLKLPEVILKSTNDGGRYAFNLETMQQLTAYDCIAYGMGMGLDEEVAKGAVWLLGHYEGKLILDADALNSLSYYQKDLYALFYSKKCDVLLTPHVKEFSRLVGLSVEEILLAGLAPPKSFAQTLDACVLLKNAVSVISDGEHSTVNVAGCSGLAKAGSGDVLSGVISGLCGMGLSVYEAGALGSYLVGKAAELAAEDMGEYSLTASDVITYLGRAFSHITKG